MSATVTVSPALALPASIVITTVSPPVVTSLSFASRVVTTMLVSLPAAPGGTVAKVMAGSAGPGSTALLYGPPPITTPLSVIWKLSVPTAVGV